MEANRWLVQNVQDTHEAGADLRCQANALGLASGKRRRGTIEGQIVESDIDQKTQALQDFLTMRPPINCWRSVSSRPSKLE